MLTLQKAVHLECKHFFIFFMNMVSLCSVQQTGSNITVSCGAKKLLGMKSSRRLYISYTVSYMYIRVYLCFAVSTLTVHTDREIKLWGSVEN